MENTKPLVSIIMGVYNTKKFDELSYSIETLLNQTYQNLEIIICDDCSTNGVFDYLMKNYSNNEKITIIRNDRNQGLASTSNRCLKYAKGQYIARQDDDDYSDLCRIEKQVSFLNKHSQFDFVSTGFTKFDKDGIWSRMIFKQEPTKRDFKYHSQHVHAATMFRRSCLEAVNGCRVNKHTEKCEDYDLFMRLYASGYKGANLPETLYYYNFPRNFTRKIKYKYKMSEARIRFYGFRAMKLPIVDYFYVLKPVLAGLLPERFRAKMKKRDDHSTEKNI